MRSAVVSFKQWFNDLDWLFALAEHVFVSLPTLSHRSAGPQQLREGGRVNLFSFPLSFPPSFSPSLPPSLPPSLTRALRIYRSWYRGVSISGSGSEREDGCLLPALRGMTQTDGLLSAPVLGGLEAVIYFLSLEAQTLTCWSMGETWPSILAAAKSVRKLQMYTYI